MTVFEFSQIVTRGMATHIGTRGTQIVKMGNHFGEEMILTSATRLTTIRCMTYLNCNELKRTDLMKFLGDTEEVSSPFAVQAVIWCLFLLSYDVWPCCFIPQVFPETNKLVRKAKARMSLRRCVAKVLSISTQTNKFWVKVRLLWCFLFWTVHRSVLCLPWWCKNGDGHPRRWKRECHSQKL